MPISAASPSARNVVTGVSTLAEIGARSKSRLTPIPRIAQEDRSGWPVNSSKLAELAFYIVGGLLWVIPAGLLIRWMQRPDPPAGGD